MCLKPIVKSPLWLDCCWQWCHNGRDGGYSKGGHGVHMDGINHSMAVIVLPVGRSSCSHTCYSIGGALMWRFQWGTYAWFLLQIGDCSGYWSTSKLGYLVKRSLKTLCIWFESQHSQQASLMFKGEQWWQSTVEQILPGLGIGPLVGAQVGIMLINKSRS